MPTPSRAAAADHFSIGNVTVNNGTSASRRTHGKEHGPRHHGHVIPRDRQHMAQAGNEHRVVDRCGDRIAAAGQQRCRDCSCIAAQRGPDPRIDRIAHVLQHRGVTRSHRPPAAGGASTVLIAPITKPDAPMPWKYMSRPKSAAAGPQRRRAAATTAPSFPRNCRRAARRPCGPTAAHPRQLRLLPRTVHLLHPQHETIGPFPLLVGFDKAFSTPPT